MRSDVSPPRGGAEMVSAPQLVSVIVTAYNAGATLEECLASICDQSHELLEVIVVDDGSTDDTRAIADAVAERDPRVCVISQANRGCASAANAGLRAATGPMLFRVDSDDVLMEAYVSDLLAMASDRPGFAAYASNAVFLGEDLGRTVFPKVPSDGQIVVDLSSLLRGLRMPYNGVFSRRYLELVGGYDVALRHGEDLDFWVRGAALGAAFLFDSAPRWFYRHVGAGKSFSIQAEAVAELEIMESLAAQLRDGDDRGDRDIRHALRFARARVVRCDLDQEILTGRHLTGVRRRYLKAYRAYLNPWAYFAAMPLLFVSPRLYGWIIARRRHASTYRQQSGSASDSR